MPTNFPNSPADGGTVTHNGTTYVYSSAKNAWKAQTAAAASTTIYTAIVDLPGSGNTAGDLAFVTDTKALHVWDGTSWQNSNADTSFYMVRAGSFTGPLIGVKTFVPDQTISLSTMTATIASSVDSDVIFSINKSGTELQQFTIVAGSTTSTSSITSNTILVTDTITFDVDSGSGENLIIKVDYV